MALAEGSGVAGAPAVSGYYPGIGQPGAPNPMYPGRVPTPGGKPAVSPIPGAAQYAQEATLANNAYDKALAQINRNRLNTLTQYGYTGTIDPKTGTVTHVGVDTHSMYGGLQQLLHGAASEDMNADMAAQDRGLVGGLAHQGRAEAHYGHQADLTNLGEQLTGSLSDLQDQQQAASETKDNALWQAEQDQLGAELTAEQNDALQQLLNPGGLYDASGNKTTTVVGGGGGSSRAAARQKALKSALRAHRQAHRSREEGI